MAIRVRAYFGNKIVEVSMLKSTRELTIYEYIDDNTASMNVMGHIRRQKYEINEETGFIELKQDEQKTVDERKLLIKPIFFDEVTNGSWDN